jgi:hypothetical protein
MGKSIRVRKHSEFFIAIAKQGVHSFMMVGVVDDDQKANHLLARVGKSNDIDPDFRNNCIMARKEIFSTTKAQLKDEGITRPSGHVTRINYQAYSITFEQAHQFMKLIREVEAKQYPGKTCMIQGLLPSAEDETGYVDFHQRHLSALDKNNSLQPHPKSQDLALEASEINIRNTCRTTARNMVNTILGFDTKVSEHFFLAPKYKTTLISGLPNFNTFYILPPPANAYQKLTKPQKKVLSDLYKRLKDIPTKNRNSTETRDKFNAVKTLYQQIAGANTLKANKLLEAIITYEKNNQEKLYAIRSPNFFSKCLGLKSSTEKTLKNIKAKLKATNDFNGPGA